MGLRDLAKRFSNAVSAAHEVVKPDLKMAKETAVDLAKKADHAVDVAVEKGKKAYDNLELGERAKAAAAGAQLGAKAARHVGGRGAFLGPLIGAVAGAAFGPKYKTAMAAMSEEEKKKVGNDNPPSASPSPAASDSPAPPEVG